MNRYRALALLVSIGIACLASSAEAQVAGPSFDYGDLPSSFGTAGGPRHLVSQFLTLGSLIDAEAGGQPSALANGDDINNADDEDGITFSGPLVPGTVPLVTVSYQDTPPAPLAAVLSAWVDYNSDGAFGAGEQAIVDAPLPATAGVVTINVAFTNAVPLSAVTTSLTYARFRLSWTRGLGPVQTGNNPEGEVEDYPVAIAQQGGLPITLEKLDSPDPVASGADLLYTLNVRNTTGAPIGGVVVTDYLPMDVSFEELVTVPANVNCTTPPASSLGGVVICTFAQPILALTTDTIEFRVKVMLLPPPGTMGLIKNRGEVVWDGHPTPSVVYQLTAVYWPCAVDLVLALDTSNTMRDQFNGGGSQSKLEYAKLYGQEMVDRVVFPPSQMGAVSFSNVAILEQQLTQDKNLLKSKIGLIAGTINSTAIETGISLSHDELLGPRHVGSNMPIMALVSDGLENPPGNTGLVIAAANKAKSDGIRIATVLTSQDPNAIVLMKQIASSSSDYYEVQTPAQLHKALQSIGACTGSPPPAADFDLGDAPDSTNHASHTMTAYSLLGILGQFPSVFDPQTGLPVGPRHDLPRDDILLGYNASKEFDADLLPDEDTVTNLDPQNDVANVDNYDDGIRFPITLPACGTTQFAYELDVRSGPHDRYVNVWLDYNQDGDWADSVECYDPARGNVTVSEWAVRDQLQQLAPGHYVLTTPVFDVKQPSLGGADIWLRISVAEQQAPQPADGRGPLGGYDFGETEDFEIRPVAPGTTDFGP